MEETLLVTENVTTESINLFKEVLLATITTINFLKNELAERKFLISTLLLRDANDGNIINYE